LVVNAASEDVEVRSYQVNLGHPHQEIVQLASLEKSLGMFRYFVLFCVMSFWTMYQLGTLIGLVLGRMLNLPEYSIQTR
jgi:hypothetical protein